MGRFKTIRDRRPNIIQHRQIDIAEWISGDLSTASTAISGASVEPRGEDIDMGSKGESSRRSGRVSVKVGKEEDLHDSAGRDHIRGSTLSFRSLVHDQVCIIEQKFQDLLVDETWDQEYCRSVGERKTLFVHRWSTSSSFRGHGKKGIFHNGFTNTRSCNASPQPVSRDPTLTSWTFRQPICHSISSSLTNPILPWICLPSVFHRSISQWRSP